VFVVSDTELRRLISMDDAIDAVERAFRSIVDGSGEQPSRLGFGDGSGLAMMARRVDSDVDDRGSAFKLVSIYPGNRERDLPTIHAVVLWFDGETGRPRLLIEGASLTSLRTGAASGLATRLLAAPGAACVAMIGAGGQAADQIRAVCAVRPIERVRVFSRGGVSAGALASRLAPELPGVELAAAATVEEALEGADVVCCATDSVVPVLPAGGVSGRVHVNSVGSFRPEMCELPLDLLGRAEIVAVDQREAVLTEAGEIIDAVDAGVLAADDLVELGALAVGPPPEPEGVSIFKTVGVAMQDWAICRLLATRIGAGVPTVELWA
jgi:ornithine cyclodeaminase